MKQNSNNGGRVLLEITCFKVGPLLLFSLRAKHNEEGENVPCSAKTKGERYTRQNVKCFLKTKQKV